jgi:hypothetical protein
VRPRGCVLGLVVLGGTFAAAGSTVAEARRPVSSVHYTVSIAGTQDLTWTLSGGLNVKGTQPECRAPVEASGHLVLTLSTPAPGKLTVTSSAGAPAPAPLRLAVAAVRTGSVAEHWAAVNPTGLCRRAPSVDTIMSQARCVPFGYRLPVELRASGNTLALTNADRATEDIAARFQGGSDDCPWLDASDGLLVGSELGDVDAATFEEFRGGLLAANGSGPSLDRLPAGVLEIPLDATATRTGTGTGEPWAGTMTVQEVVHVVATLTPTGAEDFSIEPGRGIGGVHLGDSLDAVRRMYPGADAGRRIP